MFLKQKFVSTIMILSFVLSCFLNTTTASAANIAFSFAKAIGAAGYQEANSMVVDSDGNIFIAGTFAGTVDFDPGAGTSNLVSAGSDDIFIAKYDTSGDYIWAKRIGGSSSDYASSITLDSSGNVIIASSFQGTVDFDPGAGTSNLVSAGSGDFAILKLDSSGNFVWVKGVGGTGDDFTQVAYADTSGNIYIAGTFQGTVDFDPGAGTSNLTSVGNYDIFVSKLDSSGTFVWAKRMGGVDYERPYSLTVDTGGNVYTTGIFETTGDYDPGAGTSNLTSVGNYDIFVSKLDSSGTFVWAKRMGSTGYDFGRGIAIDSSGNVNISGKFQGTVDFDPGAGTSNLTSAGDYDVFVSKLDSSGTFVWAKGMGGTGYDETFGITLDSNDNIYTTGGFGAAGDFDPGAGSVTLTPGAYYEVFISKLDSSGNFVYAKATNGTGFAYGYSLDLDSSNNVYISGYFEDTMDFDPGTGVTNVVPPSPGSGDIFLLKLTPTTTPTVSTSTASSISLTQSTLNGTISSIGGVTVTSRGFQYGLSGALDHTIEQAGSYSTGSFSSSLTNLDCGKTYSFRSYATNTEGTSYGSTTTFSTTDCPGVVALPSFNTGGGSSSSNIPPITPISPIDPISPTTPTTPASPESSSGGNTLILSGRSVKLINLPAVYYINTYNKKLIYPNWSSFLSYNKTTSDIQQITKQELDSYPTIQYIKSEPNGIVYKLTKLTKQALTQAACDRLKVLPEDVLLISQTQLDSYKKGSNILK